MKVSYSFTGIFPVKGESSLACSTRFMICSKDKWGYRGSHFRCPRGFAFQL